MVFDRATPCPGFPSETESRAGLEAATAVVPIPMSTARPIRYEIPISNGMETCKPVSIRYVYSLFHGFPFVEPRQALSAACDFSALTTLLQCYLSELVPPMYRAPFLFKQEEKRIFFFYDSIGRNPPRKDLYLVNQKRGRWIMNDFTLSQSEVGVSFDETESMALKWNNP